jgi:broad specificity phosphatase PhoE
MAGKEIKKIIGEESCVFFVSPFQRTVETFEGIAEAWGGKENVTYKIDPRIREQEWGNFQKAEIMHEQMKERRENGAFYYR